MKPIKPFSKYSRSLALGISLTCLLSLSNVGALAAEVPVSIPEQPVASIIGLVWHDVDGDGLRLDTVTEPGVASQTVQLFQDGSTVPLLEVLTGSDGAYVFSDLLDGIYRVAVDPIAPWIVGSPSTGGYAVTVGGEVPNPSYDFGIYQSGSISGAVWNDVNHDGGWQTDQEAALPGWTVTLWAEHAGVREISATAVSLNDGSFRFDIAKPGRYYVAETKPESQGWIQTAPANETGEYGPLVINSGQIDTGRNFGNYQNNIIKLPETFAVAPLLTLTLTNDATTFLRPGDRVNYTATIENTGNDTAKNMNVTAVLPKGLYFSDTLGIEKSLATGGELASGDTMTAQYQAVVQNDTATGTYESSVKVNATNHTELLASSAVEVRVVEPVIIQKAVLNLVIQSDSELANPGDTIKYTVTVSNTGNAPAVAVELAIKLSDNQTFVETGSTTRTWMLGDIPAGAKTTITFEGRVADIALAGVEHVTAQASSISVGAPVTAKTKVEVRQPEVLGAEISPAPVPTLAATGASGLDYLIPLSLGLIWLGLGSRWYWSKHRIRHVASK